MSLDTFEQLELVPPTLPKRDNLSWVGLTKEDFYKKDDETVFVLGMKFAEATLKEKNHD